jgi:hypothetical protein
MQSSISRVPGQSALLVGMTSPILWIRKKWAANGAISAEDVNLIAKTVLAA